MSVWVSKEGGARLFSVVPGEDKKQWAQVETQEIPFKHKKTLFYCDGDQTLEQITQRGCGVFILGDIQNPAGHSPEQPALADPVLSRGLD